MTRLPPTLTGRRGASGCARAAPAMPQLQKAIPAAAPVKKLLRVVIQFLPRWLKPVGGLNRRPLWTGRLHRQPVIDFFAAHIAKPQAGEQSFPQESWPEFQKSRPIRK